MVVSGSCQAVLTAEQLAPVYGMDARRIERTDGPPLLVWNVPGSR
jgi:ABC-type cobalamin transport system ATPase subunit